MPDSIELLENSVEGRKVLIVEDDPAQAWLLRQWLEQDGYIVQHTDDGLHAMDLIRQDCPDFLLTDWLIPGLDGVQLCREVRALNTPHYIYILLLSVRTLTEDIVEGLAAGADDYLSKPLSHGELLARMRAGQRVLSLEAGLNQIAQTDGLTGLATKRKLHEMLNREWPRAERNGKPIACVMIDIDFFKHINDTIGHQTGDEIIRAAADCLTRHTRESDVICRYGGDEFCAVLPETNEPQAAAWAARVRSLMANISIPSLHDSMRISASFGVAERNMLLESPFELIELADQALLGAKKAGRDRVVMASQLHGAHGLIGSGLGTGSMAGSPFAGVLAREIMTPLLATIRKSDPVNRVVDLFINHRINSAPVVDDEGKLIGMLSEKDLMAVIPLTDAWKRPIETIMTHNVVCYEEDSPAATINEFLCRVPIRRVIIVSEGKPCGSISRSSLLRWYGNWIAQRGNQPVVGGESTLAQQEEAAAPEKQLDLDHPRIRLTAEALCRQAEEITAHLHEANDELLARIVGGTSRIQELAIELLSLAHVCLIDSDFPTGNAHDVAEKVAAANEAVAETASAARAEGASAARAEGASAARAEGAPLDNKAKANSHTRPIILPGTASDAAGENPFGPGAGGYRSAPFLCS
ncbi:MAG: diguanylate cyclase [Planctomycetota bacterium]|nr:diguanylate cyclase [Planctomycetota bacterium]